MRRNIYSAEEHLRNWKREEPQVRRRLEVARQARSAEVQAELAEQSARVPMDVDRVDDLIAEARRLYHSGVDELEVAIETYKIVAVEGSMTAFRRAFGLAQ